MGNPGEHVGVTAHVILPLFLYISIENALKYKIFANFAQNSTPKWRLNAINRLFSILGTFPRLFGQNLDFRITPLGCYRAK